jgi:hypothetical protein
MTRMHLWHEGRSRCPITTVSTYCTRELNIYCDTYWLYKIYMHIYIHSNSQIQYIYITYVWPMNSCLK